jgi:hypothetical protein
MKKISFFCLLILVGTLAVSSPAQTLLKRTVVKTDKFDFGAGGTVAITGAPVGTVHVTGSNTNEIEITATIELQAYSEADLDRLATVTTFVLDEGIARTAIITSGTHNKLGDKKLWKKFPKTLLGLPFRIDYVVSVPHFCDLEIDNGKGDVSVTGVQGSLLANLIETNAHFEVSTGTTSVTVTNGSVDIAFGAHGWSGRAAAVQVGTGDLTVRLPSNLSAEIDALILRTGVIDNTFPGLKPRDRHVAFNDKSISAKARVGGPSMKFTVGDGKLRMERLVL